MLLKYCIHYASKFGKLSSGHRTGKGQFSFQSQRSKSEVAQSCPTLSDPTRLLRPWDFPGKSTGVGCHCFLLIPKKGNAKKCSHYCTTALISHASKVMLKILQARLQQYLTRELPDVQAGFRKGRGTRDEVANTCWIIKKAREFQKKVYFCFIDYAKAFDCMDHNRLWKILRDGNTRPPYLPPEKSVCRSRSNS